MAGLIILFSQQMQLLNLHFIILVMGKDDILKTKIWINSIKCYLPVSYFIKRPWIFALKLRQAAPVILLSTCKL